MKNVQKGFTLIELMIVVAIIAILAAIAIPQYQNYITKSQFSESQTIADGLKTPIVEYFNQTGNCPTAGQGSLASADASYTGKYVLSAAAGGTAPSCTILVTFKAQGSVSTPLGGQTVTFTGTNNGGSFSWTCTATGIGNQYKPTVCQ
ncbi:prepilin-type N-terminal cleavage/methylation domain-containing protein [Dyella solisilvae]|uniref:Prepilin-type N-terminal cleavage/methylation domain-containing protein n=1 Tax=Dyella solisilvae TaxID=1920168 RepID=A0A370KBZ4_9GAMM|nr:pilin [Dyella solisilvae]RDJ00175.1 prepilin-type N-terminal cleavage/methylation domain-containing protein [Dyella solisilvae]